MEPSNEDINYSGVRLSVSKVDQAADTPKPEGDAPSTYDPVPKIQKDIAAANRGINEVRDTNRLIIIVIYIAFAAMLVTFVIFGIQVISSDTSSRNDLKAQVQDLDRQTQELNNRLDQLLSTQPAKQ